MRIRRLLTITTLSLLLMSYSLDNPSSAHSPENGKGKSEPKHGKVKLVAKGGHGTKVRVAANEHVAKGGHGTKVRMAKGGSSGKHSISSAPATPTTPSTPSTPSPPFWANFIKPTSNTTAAMQEAINQATANNTGVQLVAGIWPLSTNLNVTCSFIGLPGAIVQVTNPNAAVTITGNNFTFGGTSPTAQLTFDSSALPVNHSPNLTAFLINGTYDVTVQYVLVKHNPNTVGIKAYNLVQTSVTGCTVIGNISNLSYNCSGFEGSGLTGFTSANNIYLDETSGDNIYYDPTNGGTNAFVDIIGNIYGTPASPIFDPLTCQNCTVLNLVGVTAYATYNNDVACVNLGSNTWETIGGCNLSGGDNGIQDFQTGGISSYSGNYISNCVSSAIFTEVNGGQLNISNTTIGNSCLGASGAIVAILGAPSPNSQVINNIYNGGANLATALLSAAQAVTCTNFTQTQTVLPIDDP